MNRGVRTLPTLVADGDVQMALDEELLAEAEEPTARRYLWVPATLSLGKFQRLPERSSDAQSLPIVRRPTGGRAVLHGDGFEWSFAVVVPRQAFTTESVGEPYDLVSGCLVRVLRHAGVPLDEGREAAYQRSALCFATALRYDVLAGGEKVVALAQVRRRERVLVHGSVLERRPPETVVAQVEKIVGEPWRGQGLAGVGVELDGEKIFAHLVSCLAESLAGRSSA